MPAARFIVWEDSVQWAAAWRWALADTGLWVDTVTTLDECLGLMAKAPASLIGLQVRPEELERAVRSLQLLKRSFPAVEVIVLAERGAEAAEPLLREAGALHFVASPRNLTAAARLVQRYLSRIAAAAPTFRDQVWQGLPWQQHAAAEPAGNGVST